MTGWERARETGRGLRAAASLSAPFSSLSGETREGSLLIAAPHTAGCSLGEHARLAFLGCGKRCAAPLLSPSLSRNLFLTLSPSLLNLPPP